jgi:signal transduction histidine kinase
MLYAKTRAAVQMRDEFLSIASHELKTPLATLQLQLDLMAETIASNERLAREMELAHRQTVRLAGLVETLLEVTRLTGGRMEIEREELDLVHLVSDLVRAFQPAAATSHCELAFETDVERLVGSWDGARIEQVVSSLIDNALKYGAGRPVLVAVSEHDGFARVLVRDSGIGIAKEDASRIFGRFERAVSTRHYGGFGLGLYIANEIVQAHGGRIHVGTRAEAGSEFTVILPILTGAPHEVAPEERIQ